MQQRTSLLNAQIEPGIGSAVAALAGVLGVLGTVWNQFLLHQPFEYVVVMWVIAAVLVVGGIVGDVLRAPRTRYVHEVGEPVLSWQAAERMAANHMRAYGFSDAHTTQSGADGGLDVVSRYGVAQVKYFSKPVGRPDIQKLRGAAHGQQRVLFYALTGYTPTAVQFADEADVALFQFDQYGMVWPVNGRAKAYRKPEQANA